MILRRLGVALIALGLFACVWIAALGIIAASAGLTLDLRKVSFLAVGILIAFLLGFLLSEWSRVKRRRVVGPGYENPLEG